MKNLKKVIIGLFIISLIFSLTNFVNAGAKDKIDFSKYKLGAKIEKNLKNQPKLNLSKERKLDLPSVIDHSADMPNVGDQGNQGSCVGWATSYCKGFQEKSDMNWGNIMFSPSFIYNQINDGIDGGAYQSDAYELIMEKGNCRLVTMPYDDTDWLTQPNTSQFTEAQNYKAANWDFLIDTGYFAAKTDSLKSYLQDNCLTIGIPCYSDFWTGFYDVAEGTNYGGHALCVVGYDDSKSAFKFINSWGSDYGYDGYGYISYDLWDSFVENFQCNSYGMTDSDSDPLPTPTEPPTPTDPPTETNTPIPTETATPTPTDPPIYKNKIIFNGAKTVDRKGANGAGNQWKFVMKNESKSTNIKYFQANGYPIWNSIDESLISSYDGCYIKILEVDSPYSQSDYKEIKINSLSLGKNIIYLTVYENSSNWTKWKVAVTREKVQVN